MLGIFYLLTVAAMLATFVLVKKSEKSKFSKLVYFSTNCIFRF